MMHGRSRRRRGLLLLMMTAAAAAESTPRAGRSHSTVHASSTHAHPGGGYRRTPTAGEDELRTLHGDGARLRLKLDANGRLRRVDDFTLVSLIHTRGYLDDLTDETVVAAAHGAAAEPAALRRWPSAARR